MILDVAFFIMVVLLCGALFARLVRNYPPREQRVLWYAFLAHPPAVVAHILMTENYFGGGDMTQYQIIGGQLADLIRGSADTFLPLVGQLLFQVGDPFFPITVFGIGNSTGSMQAISSLLMLLTNDSLYATCAIISSGCLLGGLAMYSATRAYFTEPLRPRLAAGLLLVPTVVYWSSGLLKESFAIMGIGLVTLGIRHWLVRSHLRATIFLGLGVFAIALFKPYVLFPLGLAASAWYLSDRALSRTTHLSLKPIYVILGLAMAIVTLAVLGEVFPRFALDRVAETAAAQRMSGEMLGAGSNYRTGIDQPRSMASLILFAPLALATALFRPFIFEARNAAQFLNTIETTTLTLVAIRLIAVRSWTWVWRAILSNPVMMFAVVFVIMMATAVGMSTGNFGTLSRYRVPLMPFFAALVFCLSAPPEAMRPPPTSKPIRAP